MTERRMPSAFEQRLALELERYVAPAVDPTPARLIADRATLGRRRPVELAARRRRRFLLLALAAVLLLPAAYLGALAVGALRADPTPTSDAYYAVVGRAVPGPASGLALYAVRSDGSERLIRTITDPVVSPGETVYGGAVSPDGWLALAGTKPPYPLVLIDLKSPDTKPWVIPEANLGGIAPAWGATGLVAAQAAATPDPADAAASREVVVVDPIARTVRRLSLKGANLLAGGPSIIWPADGSGILVQDVQDRETRFRTVRLDGGPDVPGVPAIHDPNGRVGPGGARIVVCGTGEDCPAGGALGSVERSEPDGRSSAVYLQQGSDRVMDATFGAARDEHWLLLDHDGGRQIVLSRLAGGVRKDLATVNRAADWESVFIGPAAPDESVGSVWVNDRVILVPAHGGVPTLHAGALSGYVRAPVVDGIPGGAFAPPSETLPPRGERYRLPDVDALIAAELDSNPDRHVLAKASTDGRDGDMAVHRYTLVPNERRDGQVYLDCYGPGPVSVTAAGLPLTTSPCLSSGSYVGESPSGETLTIEARGDTSWRVVVYSP